MKSKSFICAMCHVTYDKGWSDEEAAKEAKELWAHQELEDTDVVCDNCFKQMTRLIPPTKLESIYHEEN